MKKLINKTNNRPGRRTRNILDAFEHIVESAQHSNLNTEFFDNASTYIRYASRKLGLSPIQTVLLALFVDQSENTSIRLSYIASYVGCRTTRILRLSSEIDALESKHYLRATRTHDMLAYRVPEAVIRSLKQNMPYVHLVEPVTSPMAFFNRFNEMMDEKAENEKTYSELVAQTEEHLNEIKDSYFARSLNKFQLSPDDRLLFIYMAHMYAEYNDDDIGLMKISYLFDDEKIPNDCKSKLKGHTSMLFKHNLIENVDENGMACPDRYRLTEFAKSDMLSELNIISMARLDQELIRSDSFPEKKLIYNISERKQISELASILSAERFCDIQSRLKNAGMRTGFCCLFYGSPGTGKTESVYQIARATGRDIIRVDVDNIKSRWVGASEQNMKMLFQKYRNACRCSSLAPILLFNEADAVLGIRMEGATRAIDKMENSIQNIILEEMESLEGIMIATTNLTTNLDKAFERRFLYKIEFSRPDAEVRSQIWQVMLPSLSAGDARTLASQFDLSGGEIENITRRYTVSTILSGQDTIDLQAIISLCRCERISATNRTRMGFRRE